MKTGAILRQRGGLGLQGRTRTHHGRLFFRQRLLHLFQTGRFGDDACTDIRQSLLLLNHRRTGRFLHSRNRRLAFNQRFLAPGQKTFAPGLLGLRCLRFRLGGFESGRIGFKLGGFFQKRGLLGLDFFADGSLLGLLGGERLPRFLQREHLGRQFHSASRQRSLAGLKPLDRTGKLTLLAGQGQPVRLKFRLLLLDGLLRLRDFFLC